MSAAMANTKNVDGEISAEHLRATDDATISQVTYATADEPNTRPVAMATIKKDLFFFNY